MGSTAGEVVVERAVYYHLALVRDRLQELGKKFATEELTGA